MLKIRKKIWSRKCEVLFPSHFKTILLRRRLAAIKSIITFNEKWENSIAMPKFSANLSFLFNEHAFLDRFAAAREAGFDFVECAFPYEHAPETLQSILTDNRLTQVLINFPPGDLAAGDLGFASDPDRISEFQQSIDCALEYARALGAKFLNCLVGGRVPQVSFADQWRVLRQNLRLAAARLAQAGKILLIEPINTFDVPGYFLSTSKDALRLMEETQAANIMLQYDVYHMQKMEGNLTETLSRIVHRVGHIQISDNPGRHQPGTGEINYRFLLAELDRIKYPGFVGLEYSPMPDTLSSLGWIKAHGFALT
jgi:hydroxypyruvate isomerase